MITHYDLFAGIGGFSYALDTIFNEQENEHIFCEWEKFPTAVLKKHWPDAKYYGDIADLVADTLHGGLERSTDKAQRHSDVRSGERCNKTQDLTILTGGFPCQPFSHAGRRQGTSDDRYKWPEMFAVIRNVRPDWVIAENVYGLTSWNEGLVLERTCTDLEAEGYEVQPFIIPACSLEAPHKRDRVWIVAHATCPNDRRNARELSSTNEQQEEKRQEKRISEPSSTDKQSIANTGRERWQSWSSIRLQPESEKPEWKDNKHPDWSWNRDWREVALATCHDGVDDGLPRKLDGATYRNKPTDCISAAQHRKDRLKACGNAIVPQVAMEIFKSIKLNL